MAKLLSRFLDTIGNGTGTNNAIGDYSSTETVFQIKPAPGEIIEVARMIISYEDTAGMIVAEYGNTAGVLTNGIAIGCYQGDTIRCDHTGGVPIKTNGLWKAYCFDGEVVSWGSGNELFVARWSFSKYSNDNGYDQSMTLNGDNDESLRVTLNDDFTGLISHRFLVQGTIKNRMKKYKVS